MRQVHGSLRITSFAACGILSLLPTTGSEAELTSDETCALLRDLATLPAQAYSQGPVDCAAVLQCRFEARQAVGLAEEDGSSLTMEDACERVGIVLNLTESQAQQLAEDVTIDAPPGCQQFLSCIAESVASEKSAPPKSLDEAAPDWKAEFDRICAQVPVAGSLTTDRLQQLIVDTNSLIAELQGSDIPQAKLFIRRLEMCRAFFEYSIELQAEASDSPTEG